jgi:hypothetical protein
MTMQGGINAVGPWLTIALRPMLDGGGRTGCQGFAD